MKVLVTGSAGFVGAETALRLLADGHQVVGVDAMSDYYDVALKRARLDRFLTDPAYTHREFDLAEAGRLTGVFEEEQPDRVIHLAAQAGVRYSLSQPQAYIRANVDAFLAVLEACRAHPVEHLVFASSSSVYGASKRMPFSVHDHTDHPVSLYAATKKAGEMMAHTYAHLFGIPCTGLRFFTVYGPWGRPDMSPFLFAERIFRGEPIDVFNHGRHQRDFTYIDDIVDGVLATLAHPPTATPDWDAEHTDPASSAAPYRLFNIGNGQPVELLHFIRLIERGAEREAQLNMLPLQPGDVVATYADVSELERTVGYRPRTSVEEGVRRFMEWYRAYYEI
jgi:UDP-glucuronate 4-epimerase